MITIVSKLKYTAVCEKCKSEITFDYVDTNYIETGYKDGVYGIYCPVCRNVINRDTAKEVKRYIVDA